MLAAMADWGRVLTLLLLSVCSVSQLLTYAGTRSNYLQDLQVNFSKEFRIRGLLQATVVETLSPTTAPRADPPATRVLSPTPARTYLMWIGIGVFCVIILFVAIFCLCRKLGQKEVRGTQKLPHLPGYH